MTGRATNGATLMHSPLSRRIITTSSSNSTHRTSPAGRTGTGTMAGTTGTIGTATPVATSTNVAQHGWAVSPLLDRREEYTRRNPLFTSGRVAQGYAQ